MKKILFVPVLLFTICTFGQNSKLVNDKLFIDSFYQDKSTNLIYSQVASFDSLSKSTLLKKTKNWASVKFVNLKEVLVSETEDQIVLNYINSSYFVKALGSKYFESWYIRLVIQFKDGKIKCSFFDDGNVSVPKSAYSSGYNARTYFYKIYFKEEDDSTLVAKKASKDGLLSVYSQIDDTFISLKKELSTNIKENEW